MSFTDDKRTNVFRSFLLFFSHFLLLVTSILGLIGAICGSLLVLFAFDLVAITRSFLLLIVFTIGVCRSLIKIGLGSVLSGRVSTALFLSDLSCGIRLS